MSDIPLNTPVDGSTVTLPAEFCWTPRSVPTDNYVWAAYYPALDEWAATDYLGHVSCVNLGGLPASWPSDGDYVWWVRAFKGDNPEANPYNYGDSYYARGVRIRYGAGAQGSQGGALLHPAPGRE